MFPRIATTYIRARHPPLLTQLLDTSKSHCGPETHHPETKNVCNHEAKASKCRQDTDIPDRHSIGVVARDILASRSTL